MADDDYWIWYEQHELYREFWSSDEVLALLKELLETVQKINKDLEESLVKGREHK
jgi:hypothetical protein